MSYSIRNAVAVSKRRQAILRELSWLQRHGDTIEIGHRAPAYGVFGRKYKPLYPASPFMGKLPRRDKTFARRLFDNKWKYNKSKTRYPRNKWGKFIKTLSDGRRLHQFGVKPR